MTDPDNFFEVITKISFRVSISSGLHDGNLRTSLVTLEFENSGNVMFGILAIENVKFSELFAVWKGMFYF